MNDIVYPMKVHAVKLEYRRLLLEKIPHGYFKMKNGRQYVIVTFDPEKPKYNSRHPRILLSTTELGVEYTNKIISYQEIKNEYDGLLINWYANYSFAPPRVTFPIKQFYDPHCMNNAFYNNPDAVASTNPIIQQSVNMANLNPKTSRWVQIF